MKSIGAVLSLGVAALKLMPLRHCAPLNGAVNESQEEEVASLGCWKL